MVAYVGAAAIVEAYRGTTPVALHRGATEILARTPWQFFSSRAADYAVMVMARQDTTDPYNYWEASPSFGSLLRRHPARMLIDEHLWWIERFRHSDQSHQAVHVHRGDSNVSMMTRIPSFRTTGGLYVLDIEAEQYFCLRITDSTDGSTFTYPSRIGNGYVDYSAAEVTASENLLHRHPADLDPLTWLDGLSEKRLIVAFSTQNEYRPYS